MMREEMGFDVVKFVENGLEIDVNVSPNEDTVWLTKEQIALLFGRDRSVISRHIINIYKEGELDEATSVQKMHRSNNNQKYRQP